MNKLVMILLLCSITTSVCAMDKRKKRRVSRIVVSDDDFIADEIGALERGEAASAGGDDEGIQPNQLASYITTNRGVRNKYARAHLLLLVQQKYEEDAEGYARLAAEATRSGSTDSISKPEIEKLYTALIGIHESLQKANELTVDQMEGDDEDAQVERFRWHADNCREWVIGCCGIWVGVFGGALVGALSTYFGIESSC